MQKEKYYNLLQGLLGSRKNVDLEPTDGQSLFLNCRHAGVVGAERKEEAWYSKLFKYLKRASGHPHIENTNISSI